MRRWCFSFLFLLLLVFYQLDGLASSSSSSTTTPLKKPKVDVLSPQDLLSFTHYLHTCPDAEGIIQNKVRAWVKKDYTLAASIIRLHFHDCAVRGCDASILLNHTGSERRGGEGSKTLRGFQVIDEIKAEVEKRCPKTVSCADILTAAARDATILIGGPFWEVPFGRKDGKVSIAREANTVPQGHENITALIHFFQARGLNLLDLVVLSGSHTIGRTTCRSIKTRLFHFNNGNGNRRDMMPPSSSLLNATYMRVLKRKCRRSYYDYVDLDGTTPRKFDNEYYKNMEKKMGLFSTDQGLYTDARTSPIVQVLATQPDLFINQFAVSMVKLGNVQLLTAKNHGEIRGNCNFVNPP